MVGQQREVEKGEIPSVEAPGKGKHKVKLEGRDALRIFKTRLKGDKDFADQKLKIEVYEDFYESLGEKEKTAFDKLLQERYESGDTIILQYGHKVNLTYCSEKRGSNKLKPVTKDLTIPSWASDVIIFRLLNRTVKILENVRKLDIRLICKGNGDELTFGAIKEALQNAMPLTLNRTILEFNKDERKFNLVDAKELGKMIILWNIATIQENNLMFDFYGGKLDLNEAGEFEGVYVSNCSNPWFFYREHIRGKFFDLSEPRMHEVLSLYGRKREALQQQRWMRQRRTQMQQSTTVIQMPPRTQTTQTRPRTPVTQTTLDETVIPMRPRAETTQTSSVIQLMQSTFKVEFFLYLVMILSAWYYSSIGYENSRVV